MMSLGGGQEQVNNDRKRGGWRKKLEPGLPDLGYSKTELGPFCLPLLRNLLQLTWTHRERMWCTAKKGKILYNLILICIPGLISWNHKLHTPDTDWLCTIPFYIPRLLFMLFSLPIVPFPTSHSLFHPKDFYHSSRPNSNILLLGSHFS